MDNSMPFTIAILNQKGGVGKTTTSINLATCIARKGHRVLLVDLDPQGNASLITGSDPSDLNPTMYEVLTEHVPSIQDVVIPIEHYGFDIAPSNLDLDIGSQVIFSKVDRNVLLAKALVGAEYDFCIVDCPPTLGVLAYNAIYAANAILVPCEMSLMSFQGLGNLLGIIDKIKKGMMMQGTGTLVPNFVRIVITRYDDRRSRTNLPLMQKIEFFQPFIFETKIRQNEMINQCFMDNVSILDRAASSHGSQDYQSLTEEILTQWINKL